MLMVNAVRHKFELGMLQAANTGTVGPMSTTPCSSVGTAGKIKIKLSQVVDQGSDVEIEQLDATTLQRARRLFAQSEGDAPLEKLEVTERASCKSGLWTSPFRRYGHVGSIW